MKPRHWPGVTVKYSGLLAATKASVFAVEAKSEGVRPLFQNTEAGTVEGFSPVAPDVFGSHNWNSMRELPLYHRNGGGTHAERWRMISETWKTIVSSR
jgi:hypothetical protein